MSDPVDTGVALPFISKGNIWAIYLSKESLMALSIAEMELEAVEFIPAREVMCGGCGGGGTYQSQSHNFDGNGDGNGSWGVLNGALDGNFNNDNVYL